MTRRRAWSIVPYLFIMPAMVGLGLFKLYPIMEGLRLSFYDVKPIARTQEFIGLANFLELVRDPVILRATWNTLLFNLLVTPTQIVLALALAVLVNRKGKVIQAFRSLFFMPAVISLVVASIIWKLMYNPDSGLVNGLLIAVSLPAQTFLTSTSQAMASVMGMVVWKGVGYWMVILLAGLKDIPEGIQEAAIVDGAGPSRRFFSITFPLLSPTLLFVVVADTVINFLLFVPVYVMTQGGPSESTTLLMFEVYRNAFVYTRFGYAAAISTTLLLVIAVAVTVQMRFLRVEFEY
ncbi:MAG: transporter permease [candidate division NC10 bacterium]|jgi:ABC-type sugar transport system permease subunit|nr:transporter permease [candidate division NC10 bacterium]